MHADPPAPLLVALGVIAVVVAIDATLGERVVLIGLVVSAPLLCGLTTTPARTRIAALAAVTAALLAAIWNDNVDSWSYWVPLSVVTMASVFAVLMAVFRQRLRRETARMRAMAEIGVIATGTRNVQDTAQAIAEVLVPSLADFCVIDRVTAEGQAQRLAGTFTGDPALMQRFMARPPSRAEVAGSSAGTIATQRPALISDFDDEARQRLAHDAADLDLLRAFEMDSIVSVPLVARGRTVGVLTLGTMAPRTRFDSEAVGAVATIGGRAALALDNAALSRELSSTEQQLEAILRTVDAAIMVRSREGALVYANRAAADLLRVPDPQALLGVTSQELMARFEAYDEHGEAIDLTDLPGQRVLAGDPAPPPVLVRNIVRATGEERWLLNKATPVVDDEGRPVMAVNLIDDVTESKRGELAQAVLAEAARQPTDAAGLAETLQAMADAAVPGLADWALIDLAGARGGLRPVAVAHRDPELRALGWRLRTAFGGELLPGRPLSRTAASGEPTLWAPQSDEELLAGATSDEHREALRRANLRSGMVVALRAGEEVLGTLTFVSSTARRFDARDLDLASDLGRQAGVAIKNAQLNHERAHIAHTLQAGLLPDSLPSVEGWAVSSVYRPAGVLNEVGGDFYDVVGFPRGWAVLIGDVVGKGAEAAALTAMVRHTLAAVIATTGDPAHALRVANDRLRTRQDVLPALCTVAIVTVSAGDEVLIHSAGHPLPLLRRGGEVHPIGRTSPTLGIEHDVDVVGTTAHVRPGDQLLLYTDGVIDATGETGRFGEERLVRALSSLDADGEESVARLVLRSIDAFARGEQSDDIAMISLERTNAGALEPRAA